MSMRGAKNDSWEPLVDQFKMGNRHEAPHQTFNAVRNANNPTQAVRALEESMAEYAGRYAKEGFDTRRLDGDREVWRFTHFYLKKLAELLKKEGNVQDPSGHLVQHGLLPQMSIPWLKVHAREVAAVPGVPGLHGRAIDVNHDGYIQLRELKAARNNNPNLVENAFLDHLIGNYTRLATDARGIRVTEQAYRQRPLYETPYPALQAARPYYPRLAPSEYQAAQPFGSQIEYPRLQSLDLVTGLIIGGTAGIALGQITKHGHGHHSIRTGHQGKR